MQVSSSLRESLITGGKTVADVSEDISRQVEGKPTPLWWGAFGFSLVLLAFGVYTMAMTLWNGIGMWGLNKTVGWAWDITNFVWWVGIGHAGTLISAILLLFRQKWRSGGDDHLCRNLCGQFPADSHGAFMVRILLGTPFTECIWFTLGKL